MRSRRQQGTPRDAATASAALRRYSFLAGTIVAASAVYVSWFVAGIVKQGIRSDWRFNRGGLAALSVHAALVAAAGAASLALLLRVSSVRRGGARGADGADGDDDDERRGRRRCDAPLQFLVPVLCLASSAGYFFFYVPLQSSFVVWLCRWVPWLALGLAGFAPCCCARECILARYDDDGSTAGEAGVYEGGRSTGGDLAVVVT